MGFLTRLKNYYHLLTAIFFVFFYRFPSRKLTLIGVTGTDGKTTTVNLIYHLLKSASKKVSMVSSVNAVIGDKVYDTGFHVTTPDPGDVQKYLRQAVDAGSQYFVLESTSHGLVQNRLFGCFFKIGVATNITHEHLDYHKNYRRYLMAKAKLFSRVKLAVLNKDDRSYLSLSKICKDKKCLTYSLKGKADFTLSNFPFKTNLLGDYNQANCLAAIAVASSLGVDRKTIQKALASFKGLVGRLEKIDDGQNFQVIVDFAHTPNALSKVLELLQKEKAKNGKLIAVFGAAGLRDIKKRFLMGEVSGNLADVTILTAEDPRTEDVNRIITRMAQGCNKAGSHELELSQIDKIKNGQRFFFRVPDRGQAIEFAIQKIAQSGDVVVICGKGHEKSMCYGKTEYPWSDQEAALKVLKGRK